MTHLILIGGLAAAGKTTLGRELARVTKFAFLDKDTLTQPLVEALLSAVHAPGGVDDRQSDIYLNRVRPHEYHAFLNTMMENVTLGVSTIAVAPFLREMADEAWLDGLRRKLPAATIQAVWLQATDAVLHQRMVSRASTRDRDKLGNNWAGYLSGCRKIRPAKSCLVIEARDNEEAKELAVRTLSTMGIDAAASGSEQN